MIAADSRWSQAVNLLELDLSLSPGLVFCSDLSPASRISMALLYRTAALPFGTQTLHAKPKPRLQADFTEMNTLFYLGIKSLHSIGSVDTGEWEYKTPGSVFPWSCLNYDEVVFSHQALSCVSYTA